VGGGFTCRFGRIFSGLGMERVDNPNDLVFSFNLAGVEGFKIWLRCCCVLVMVPTSNWLRIDVRCLCQISDAFIFCFV
jgi:hypothetical protein